MSTVATFNISLHDLRKFTTKGTPKIIKTFKFTKRTYWQHALALLFMDGSFTTKPVIKKKEMRVEVRLSVSTGETSIILEKYYTDYKNPDHQERIEHAFLRDRQMKDNRPITEQYILKTIEHFYSNNIFPRLVSQDDLFEVYKEYLLFGDMFSRYSEKGKIKMDHLAFGQMFQDIDTEELEDIPLD